MAAVITLQSPSTTGPTAATAAPFQQPSSDHIIRPRVSSHQQPASTSTPLSPPASIGTLPRVPVAGRDGPSCDACLRRKSRCAMNEMVKKCYSCDFHRQDCTFTLSAVASRPSTADLQSKKRKLDESAADDVESSKRYGLSLQVDIPVRFRTLHIDRCGNANLCSRCQTIDHPPGFQA